jgi:hypothetical protein
MATSLLLKQTRFTLAVANLIHMAVSLGYRAKLTDVYRDPEWQKILVQRGKSKTTKSRHNVNLAADLHLFEQDGRWLDGKHKSDYKAYKQLGDWWEELGPDYVWGGDWDRDDSTPHSFVDMVHFEVVP